ncbi:DUF4056 domain-containing protein [Draconibacterium sp.]|nr:DUF4056 domain-containing protein [Draconibacterium sp.]
MQNKIIKVYYQSVLKMLVAGGFILLILPSFAKAPFLTTKDLSSPPPRIIRTCCSFGVDLSYAVIPFAKRTDITSIEELGNHHYMGNKDENNGIIYTRRGGFIDTGHLRDCADWTAFLYQLIQSKQGNQPQSLTTLGAEGGAKTLMLEIPMKIDSLVAYQVAGKIAYELSLWHEIATWFGVSYIPMVPERYSSFSPEDLYSNLLGVELGIRALKSELEYDDAMTQVIANMLDSLEAVSTPEETYWAMENVQNIWWTKEKSLPNKKILLERYVDSDCYLTPWLVPNETNKLSPFKLNKPENYQSELYTLKIKVNHKFPLAEILPTHENRIITQKDFVEFMAYISGEINALNLKVAKQLERKKKRKDSKQESRT